MTRRYKTLSVVSYILFGISFIIPAYSSNSWSFCCGGTEVWFGWKCAAVVFALIFTQNTLFGLLLSLPNIVMIVNLFMHKRISQAFTLVLTVVAVSSCSYWWIMSLGNGEIRQLLPGYWLWLVSITGNGVILFLSKRKHG